MQTVIPKIRTLLAASALTALWLFVSVPVRAQTLPAAPAADITAKHLKLAVKQKSMSDIIAMLSEQLGCSIVADDTPLKKQADVDIEGTGKEVLDKVAETFDYAWTLNRRGIIAMHKAFKDPKDAPQANLPEMRKMAQQAIAVLRVFPTDADRQVCFDQARQLYNLFSPDLKTQLQTGKHLHISDMTPQQSELLQRIVRNEMFAGVIQNWERLLDMLTALPSARLQYHLNDNYSSFFYYWFSPQNPEERTWLAGWREGGLQKP